MRDAGGLELAVMLGIAVLAYAGAPYYVAVLGASLLVLTTIYEYAPLQPRLVRAGASTMAGSMLATAAMSVAFASLCFVIGRTFAWLIAG
jgi:asparagine N-glycosylation enzyme membrane subunit Stt3